MNRSVRRLLQSLASYERDLNAARARADARRRAAWLRLAELRAEQAKLDLYIERDRYHPPPPPAPEISFQYETIPAAGGTGEGDASSRTAETTTDGLPSSPPHDPAPSTAPGPSAQGKAVRLKDGASGRRMTEASRRRPSPLEHALAIWAKLGEDSGPGP